MLKILLIILLSGAIGYGQSTYAVIVGVSIYASDDIANLHYAHADAREFAEYLVSPAGGLVPKDNIRLVVNQNATHGRIYLELEWLEKIAKKGDTVYFYFSGHGKVDKKKGYLLAHNSPKNNLRHSAIKVEEINEIAHILAIKNVKVRLISDACYSGGLSGDDNIGSIALGSDMDVEKKRVVRFTSCKPDQKSHEGSDWGGGRGAFSFHLINGLIGLADIENGDKDGEVQLGELYTYVRFKVKTDVKYAKQKVQEPDILGGDIDNVLGVIDTNMLLNLIDVERDDSLSTLEGAKSDFYEATLMDKYFDLLSEKDIKNDIDFDKFNQYDSDQIMDAIVDRYREIKGQIGANYEWQKKMTNERVYRNTFKRKLAALISDDAQSLLNAYLDDDKNELEKRGFYVATNKDFEEYSYMLGIAMKLILPNNHMYESMQFKKKYFEGVSRRLEAELVMDNLWYLEDDQIIDSTGILSDSIEERKQLINLRDSLLASSLEKQLSADSLSLGSAYINNEMGLLYFMMDSIELSVQQYSKAINLDTTWALPMAKLANVKYRIEEYSEGFKLATKALKYKPNYFEGHLTRGLNAKEMNNFLVAEDALIKASGCFDGNFLLYENLAKVYMMTNRYELSNSNYVIRDSLLRFSDNNPSRMNQFHNIRIPTTGSYQSFQRSSAVAVQPTASLIEPQLSMYLDSTLLAKDDLRMHFVYAHHNYNGGNDSIAESHFDKVVSLNNADPLVYYYLANINFSKKNYQQAERYILLAKKYYLEGSAFSIYVNALDYTAAYNEVFAKDEYTNATFERVEIDYLLADIYSNMGYTKKALNIYSRLSKSGGLQAQAYDRLLEMYVSRGLYEGAESLVREHHKNKNVDINELVYDLYLMAAENESSKRYHYIAAVFLYDLLKNNTRTSIDNILDKGIYHFSESLKHAKESEKEDIFINLGELYQIRDLDPNTKDLQSFRLDSEQDSIAGQLAMLPVLVHFKEYSEAYDILNGLRQESRIDYEGLEYLCGLSILANDWERTNSLIEQLESYPYDESNMARIKGLRSMLAGDYKESLAHYLFLYNKNIRDPNVNYTLCRLYAQLDMETEAEKHLRNSINNRFNSYWVLINDPLLEPLAENDFLKMVVNRLKAINN